MTTESDTPQPGTAPGAATNPGGAHLRTRLEKPELDRLLETIRARGYATHAPVERDGAVLWQPIGSSEELPIGRTDEQTPGHYRLRPGEAGEYFGVRHGPQSIKEYTFAPRETLVRVRRCEDGGLATESRPPEPERIALIGARACDLAALAIQERIFLYDQYEDPFFRARRDRLLVVAIHCTRAQPTCFCASMGTGPRARSHFDLALTELDDGFLLESRSRIGEEIAAELDLPDADAETVTRARAAVAACGESQTRGIDREKMPGGLYAAHDHPRWDEVATRCLSCANCTLVCPTCFCHSVEEVPSLDMETSERVRRWDSCFSPEHGYIHGKNLRPTTRERYRMWLTHKLASWIDQFGSSGCVGCGRCISWCPVGIDITEEAAALLEES